MECSVVLMFLILKGFNEGNLLPHEWCFILTPWVDSIYIYQLQTEKQRWEENT